MKNQLLQALKNLYQFNGEVHVERTDYRFGDYASNVAMQLAKYLGKNPRQIAEEIAGELQKSPYFKEVTVAGPGFLNMRLSDKSLDELTQQDVEKTLAGQIYTVEYSCPNFFKAMHTGHLYNTIYGNVLVNLMNEKGAKVHRVSYGADVGLNAGKCLYGMVKNLDSKPENLENVVANDVVARANWVTDCYVLGAQTYESGSEEEVEKIREMNKMIYKIHEDNDQESDFAKIYWAGAQWSLDYHGYFYDKLNVPKMDFYTESQATKVGLPLCKELYKKGYLEESQGAIVYHPKNKKLHTRVFITSEGLPTYEAKDIGIINIEYDKYNFDHRIILTGADQKDYMQVVFEAVDLTVSGIKDKMTSLTNGTVKFADGKKMSSRLGNVTFADDVVNAVFERVSTMIEDEKLMQDVANGAIKYAFCRYKLGGDISFDIDETVSIQGNSGPYLQYSHARACSILTKVAKIDEEKTLEYDEGERQLMLKLGEYTKAVDKAKEEYEVHHICNYLYELAQEFNRFYEHSRIVQDEREAHRARIVKSYRDTLAKGLNLLGISAPEKM